MSIYRTTDGIVKKIAIIFTPYIGGIFGIIDSLYYMLCRRLNSVALSGWVLPKKILKTLI
jgi:hypothetical protein